MVSRRDKSKKRLTTSEGLRKSLSGTVFFIDRSAGRAVAKVFDDCGVACVLKDDLFAQTTPDVEWIRECGARDYVVISADREITRNTIETSAIMNEGLAAFFFSSADWNTNEKLEILAKALPKIAGMLTAQRRPFIATISKSGAVELQVNYKGEFVRKKK